jgi:hypothetical protein
MSQTVKQTISVRSGNVLADSIIFTHQGKCGRESTAISRSRDFRVSLREICVISRLRQCHRTAILRIIGRQGAAILVRVMGDH